MIFEIMYLGYMILLNDLHKTNRTSEQQNSRTLKLGYNTSLLLAEFQFFKGLVYASKLLLSQKMLLRVIIAQSSR